MPVSILLHVMMEQKNVFVELEEPYYKASVFSVSISKCGVETVIVIK